MLYAVKFSLYVVGPFLCRAQHKIGQKRFGVYAIVGLWKKTDEKSGLRNHAWREKDRGTHVQTSEESLCQVQVEAALGSERIEGRNEKRKKGKEEFMRKRDNNQSIEQKKWR